MELKTEVYISKHFKNSVSIYIDENKIEAIAIDNMDGEKRPIYWPHDEVFKDIIKELILLQSNKITEVWTTSSMLDVVTAKKRYIVYLKKEDVKDEK